MMRKIFPAAVILALVAGCASNGGFLGTRFGADGSNTGVRSDTTRSDVGVRNEVGSARTDPAIPGNGSDIGTRGAYVTTAPGYADPAYPRVGSRDPYTGGAVLPFDDKFWPPVVRGQPFPEQHMWAD